ncbi:MAG: DUF411 domain-containing protein [Rhodospirillales bacterium]|nr:DUF411 domain-containing protein [Rhodospirillales bacterium]MCW8861551.1 DUF411 domain-containing protein [Rhodospirillales bacterium]MCW9002801.1 DUF411 domain-containing protein [Rhodospirillales bacterium]
MRNLFLVSFALLLLSAIPVHAEGAPEATVFKDPQCGCCGEYVKHLRAANYRVTVKNIDDMVNIKRLAGVPEELESCHTTVIDGYVFEGHVPLDDVARVLKEKPDIPGISLPGMPTGVPGMPGPKPERLTVYTLEKNPKPYSVR